MEEKNDNAFQFEPTSFWEDLPQYERVDYISVTNQETGEVVLVPAENLKTNNEQQIIQEVDKFYYRYNLLQQNINPEKTKQIAHWLREQSNLLRLVATQLAFHLLKLYEHLLKVRIETKQVLEIDVGLFTVINDHEGNPVEVELNLDEARMEQLVISLEKSFAPGFDLSGTWEVCAKDILTYLSVSALEKMEKDLGTKAVEDMNSKSREKTFHMYMNSELSESLEDNLSLLLHKLSQDLTESFISGLDIPNLKLSDLDKLLGFEKYSFGNSTPVTEPLLANSILPVSTGFPMSSSILAQLEKDLWKPDVNKVAYFQHKAKGNPNNYIEHYISSPGDIRLLPWEQAEQIIDKFGFNTVKLHLIFAAHTMNHFEPWKNKFILKGSDIIKELGWDRRNDLATYEKLNEIANTAFALSCLLLKAVWSEGNGKNKIDCSISTSRVWDVMVDVRSGQQGKIDQLHEVYLTVRPGLWFEKFLNEAGAKAKEALYQFGYIAKQVLKIDPYHDELALRMAIYLTMDSRIHRSGEYRVKTLLEAPSVVTRSVIDLSRNDKRKAYELKQRWDNALKLLMNLGWQIEFDPSYPEWLRPGSKAQKPSGWREVKIIDWLLGAKITIKPPAPIPELLAAKIKKNKKPQSKPKLASSISLTGEQIRKAREGKGWSQRKLAGWLGVTQTLIGYWEKGKRSPSADMEAKLRHLLEITN